jgi:hypothetical protein
MVPISAAGRPTRASSRKARGGLCWENSCVYRTEVLAIMGCVGGAANTGTALGSGVCRVWASIGFDGMEMEESRGVSGSGPTVGNGVGVGVWRRSEAASGRGGKRCTRCFQKGNEVASASVQRPFVFRWSHVSARKILSLRLCDQLAMDERHATS